MGTQKTPKSQVNLEKDEWNRRNDPPYLQTILQSYSHQHSMVSAQNKNIDQQNMRESPEMKPHTYGHLIFDKGGKNMQREKNISSMSGMGKLVNHM